jgi:DNA-binding transcriptional LysR family regulator
VIANSLGKRRTIEPERIRLRPEGRALLASLAGLTVQGLGLAMLPVYVGRNTPGLVPVEQFTGGPTTGLWVATHRDFRQQNHIETLLDFFTTAFRSDAQHLI